MNKYEQLGLWFVSACKAAWMPPYTFSFKDSKSKQYAMEVEVDPSYLSVVVKVGPRFWDKSPKEQRLYLAHELWHVIADRADKKAEEAIAAISDDDEDARTRLDREYRNEAEKLADHAANLLMSVLPDWHGVKE